MAIRVVLTIGSLTIRDREIDGLEIAQALGDHDRLHAVFHRDPSKAVEIANLIAPAVSVALTDDQSKTTVTAFTGVGTRWEEQHQLHGGSKFTLEALSSSEKFSRRHHVGQFPDAAFADIVSRFPDVTVGAAPKVQRKSFYVQAGEDDLSFLSRLADDHQSFVRPLKTGLEIRHGFDDKRHVLTFGVNLQSITSRVEAFNPREKSAFYEFGKKEEVLLRDKTQDAPMSGASTLTDAVKQKAGTLDGGLDPNVLDTTARMTTIGEFRDALLRESERTLGSAVTIGGVSTNIELVVGDTIDIQEGQRFKLENAPGTVGLIKLTHIFDKQQYRNEFTASPWINYVGASAPPRRVRPGLITAEVTDNKDPLNLGRIRVRTAGVNPGNEGAHIFARLLTPFAGNGRGIAFLPEIGDEVVLGFEEGDPERPYVVGSVWNGKDVSPGPSPKRIITKAGNQISMDDAGVIEIFSPGGTCLMQLSNSVDGNPRITIHSEGDLFLEAKDRLQLKCNELVELVHKDASRDVGGDEQTNISGGRTLVVGGADSTQSGSITMVAGLSSFEIGIQSVTTQSVQVNSVAKVMNVVMGALVQLNPPGFVVPPATSGSIDPPETKDPIPVGRGNPKPTERVKVTREDGPTS